MGFSTFSGERVVVMTSLLVLLITASLLSVAMANRPFAGDKPANRNSQWNWNTGGGPFNNTIWGPRIHPNNNTRPPKKFIVGGSAGWHYGFNYTDWALKNGPFYINDTLVFKYDPPNSTTFPHSVYLLPNFWSFMSCDLSRAKQVATAAQGGGKKGFEFVLRNWWPHYFACGEHDGIHCKEGMMKFFVMPLFRPCHG